MPYFTRISPAGPIAGGINLPSPPPVVGTRVALMGSVFPGIQGVSDWIGRPEQGTIFRALGYGVLGSATVVAAFKVPSFLSDFKRLAKYGKLAQGLMVGVGGWTLYRALMNGYGALPEGVAIKMTGTRMGSIVDTVRGWAGIPSKESISSTTQGIGKVATYGLLGIGCLAGAGYLPGVFWPLKVGKAALFFGGAWLIYRAGANFIAMTSEGTGCFDASGKEIPCPEHGPQFGQQVSPQENVSAARYSEIYAAADARQQTMGHGPEEDETTWTKPWLTQQEANELRAMLAQAQINEARDPRTGFDEVFLNNINILLEGAPDA